MAAVQALGKPSNASTFGDLADCFCDRVFANLQGSQTRLDIVFDEYRQKSIKADTRVSRSAKRRKITRIIDGRGVRLPAVWQTFISLQKNKLNLIDFLREQILVKAKALPANYEVVVSGGDRFPAVSSSARVVSHLNSSHEEANTKIVLHCADANAQNFQRVVVCSRDTDVLLLLIYHATAEEVWLSAGTTKEKIFVPVHTVQESLDVGVRNNLLAYHALTGSDTTSQFSGHGKALYVENIHRVSRAVEGPRSKPKCTYSTCMADIELFVVKLYSSTSKATSVNALRVELFHRLKDPEKLPPTQDKLSLHALRSHYQALIWYKAAEANPDHPQPVDFGWDIDETGLSLRPKLMTLPPVPTACTELVTCGCKTTCSNQRCTCRKHNISCSAACSCQENCLNTPHSGNDSASDDKD